MKKLIFPALSVIYTLFLLSLSFTAIPIEDFLKSAGIYERSISALYVLTTLVAFGWLLFSLIKKKWLSILSFPLIGLAYFALFKAAEYEADKIHIAAYAFLAALYWDTLKKINPKRGQTRGSDPFCFLMAGILCALVSLAGEGLQLFVPNRFFEWKDVAAGVSSSLLAILFAQAVEYHKK